MNRRCAISHVTATACRWVIALHDPVLKFRLAARRDARPEIGVFQNRARGKLAVREECRCERYYSIPERII